MDVIANLYDYYTILLEGNNDNKYHLDLYSYIINASIGSIQEKRLASQFIRKFFKYFPDLWDDALNAEFILCNDADVHIRRQVIQDFPLLCRENTHAIVQVSYLLCNLLVHGKSDDFDYISNALKSIIKLNVKDALTGLFKHILNGQDQQRQCCLRFIGTQLFNIDGLIITEDIDEFLIKNIKKAFLKIRSKEFYLCMNVLKLTRLSKTLKGRYELIQLAKEQANLNVYIDEFSIDDDLPEKFIQCARSVIPYLSHTFRSTEFVIFICDKLFLIDVWDTIGYIHRDQMQSRLLKVFAEMSMYCDAFDNAKQRINNVYKLLREYMPLPILYYKNRNNCCNGNINCKGHCNGIKINPSPTDLVDFSHIECLLYILYALSKKHPNQLSYVSDADIFKNFRMRLQYFARCAQAYMTMCKNSVRDKCAKALQTKELKFKLMAIRTTSNIIILIRNLYRLPEFHNIDIVFSWIQPKLNIYGRKRHPYDSDDQTNGKIILKRKKFF